MSMAPDLELLAERLASRFGGARPPLAVRVTNRGRQLVMAPVASEIAPPRFRFLKKRSRPAPTGTGFELYVTVEDPDSATPSQRMILPGDAGQRLELAQGVRERSWTLPGPAGTRVIVRLQLSEGMPAADSDELLDILNGALAA